jgi:hypothetical protein
MDYAAIAKIIKEIMNGSNLKVALVNTLSRYFKETDSSFNSKSFKADCSSNGCQSKEINDDEEIEEEPVPVKLTNQPKINFNFQEVEEALLRMPSIVTKTLGNDKRKNSKKA